MKSLADTKDQLVLLVLTFALKEPIGKSYSRDKVIVGSCVSSRTSRRKTSKSVQAYSKRKFGARKERNSLKTSKRLATEFECFLQRKCQRKIDKRVAKFKAHLEEQHD